MGSRTVASRDESLYVKEFVLILLIQLEYYIQFNFALPNTIRIHKKNFLWRTTDQL
jgi:hypothetical protein